MVWFFKCKSKFEVDEHLPFFKKFIKTSHNKMVNYNHVKIMKICHKGRYDCYEGSTFTLATEINLTIDLHSGFVF